MWRTHLDLHIDLSGNDIDFTFYPAGSSFGLAILQACDPPTFTAMRNRPTNPKVRESA